MVRGSVSSRSESVFSSTIGRVMAARLRCTTLEPSSLAPALRISTLPPPSTSTNTCRSMLRSLSAQVSGRPARTLSASVSCARSSWAVSAWRKSSTGKAFPLLGPVSGIRGLPAAARCAGAPAAHRSQWPGGRAACRRRGLRPGPTAIRWAARAPLSPPPRGRLRRRCPPRREWNRPVPSAASPAGSFVLRWLRRGGGGRGSRLGPLPPRVPVEELDGLRIGEALERERLRAEGDAHLAHQVRLDRRIGLGIGLERRDHGGGLRLLRAAGDGGLPHLRGGHLSVELIARHRVELHLGAG